MQFMQPKMRDPRRKMRFRVSGETTSRDFRLICDCQEHRRLERVAVNLRIAGRRGGAAALLAASLGLGAVNLPAPVIDYAQISRERDEVAASIAPVRTSETPAQAIEDLFFGTPKGTRRLISERVSQEFFRTAMPYGEIIYDEARRNGLPPELVAAVVNTESNFRPWLRSGKNAMGLMQLIPSTGRLMGARDLYDPVDNVRAGTRYLRYLNRRFKGNVVMMLAAYNAGEGNIERFGGMPPFRETLNYIRRVTVTRDQLARELANRIVQAEAGRPLPPRRIFHQPVRVYESQPVLEAELTAPEQASPSEMALPPATALVVATPSVPSAVPVKEEPAASAPAIPAASPAAEQLPAVEATAATQIAG
jgi:soluble lytic murein transglycosylase-like protein